VPKAYGSRTRRAWPRGALRGARPAVAIVGPRPPLVERGAPHIYGNRFPRARPDAGQVSAESPAESGPGAAPCPVRGTPPESPSPRTGPAGTGRGSAARCPCRDRSSDGQSPRAGRLDPGPPASLPRRFVRQSKSPSGPAGSRAGLNPRPTVRVPDRAGRIRAGWGPFRAGPAWYRAELGRPASPPRDTPTLPAGSRATGSVARRLPRDDSPSQSPRPSRLDLGRGPAARRHLRDAPSEPAGRIRAGWGPAAIHPARSARVAERSAPPIYGKRFPSVRSDTSRACPVRVGVPPSRAGWVSGGARPPGASAETPRPTVPVLDRAGRTRAGRGPARPGSPSGVLPLCMVNASRASGQTPAEPARVGSGSLRAGPAGYRARLGRPVSTPRHPDRAGWISGTGPAARRLRRDAPSDGPSPRPGRGPAAVLPARSSRVAERSAPPIHG